MHVRFDGGPGIKVTSVAELIVAVAEAIEADGRQTPLKPSRSKNPKTTRKAGSKVISINKNRAPLVADFEACVAVLNKPVEIVLAETKADEGIVVTYAAKTQDTPSEDGVQDLHPPAPTHDDTEHAVWTKAGGDMTDDDLEGIRLRGEYGRKVSLKDRLALGRRRQFLIDQSKDWKWMIDRFGYKERRLQDFTSVANVLDGNDQGTPTVDLNNEKFNGVGVVPDGWTGIEVAIKEIRQLRKKAKQEEWRALSDEAKAAKKKEDEQEKRNKKLKKARDATSNETFGKTGELFADYVKDFPELGVPAADGIREMYHRILMALAPEERVSFLVDDRDFVEEHLDASADAITVPGELAETDKAAK